MLEWKKLLNSTRRKSIHVPKKSLGTKSERDEAERDYDRILFAAPTRRLADKTQVFPMEQHDSVRTRLTHSYEVSNLARSIGVRLAFTHADKVFGKDHDQMNVKRTIPAMLAAIGLAHDLGNPPFGHQGESSMRHWFRECAATNSVDIEKDFLEFDGNAQTFRLMTKLQILNDDYGLNLTVATLAALIKYPSVYGEDKFGFSKWGIFKSEKKIAEEVWDLTGLQPGIRHPLTIIMESCDDIAYSIIDAEDTIKKGYASFYDLIDHIQSDSKDSISRQIVKDAKRENALFKKSGLSSRELNDVSMQIFRAIAISKMIDSVVDSFVLNVDAIMDGSISPGFELIKNASCERFCKAVKSFDRRHGFQHRDVLRLELKGHNYIHSMMDRLWSAVGAGIPVSPFDKYVYGGVSENYRRVFETSRRDDYSKRQLVCDAVSGMTESYLVKQNEELSSLC